MPRIERNPLAFLDRVLDPPSYGFVRNHKLYVPTRGELVGEFFSHLNVFRSRKNWLALFSWFVVLFFAPFFVLAFTRYFHWTLALAGFLYSMVVLGTHGTVYLHRYASHRAFTFTNRFWRFLTSHLVVKIVPEEAYVVSHHVHHYIPEQPGDPYNVHGGWLYCFLADVNHQRLASGLSEADYSRAANLLGHTGVQLNSYEGYQKWGTLSKPFGVVLNFLLNWAFWFCAFYLIGGLPLAVTLFGWCGVWAVGIRTFNFEGHGRGKDLRKEGIDFNDKDLSINQVWPGMVTGEWHNNHHLYPKGARAGFLPYQWDYAWWLIRSFHFLGGIGQYHDYKEEFLSKYYAPYLVQKNAKGPVAPSV